jgi:hypothetical protein
LCFKKINIFYLVCYGKAETFVNVKGVKSRQGIFVTILRSLTG